MYLCTRSKGLYLDVHSICTSYMHSYKVHVHRYLCTCTYVLCTSSVCMVHMYEVLCTCVHMYKYLGTHFVVRATCTSYKYTHLYGGIPECTMYLVLCTMYLVRGTLYYVQVRGNKYSALVLYLVLVHRYIWTCM